MRPHLLTHLHVHGTARACVQGARAELLKSKGPRFAVVLGGRHGRRAEADGGAVPFRIDAHTGQVCLSDALAADVSSIEFLVEVVSESPDPAWTGKKDIVAVAIAIGASGTGTGGAGGEPLPSTTTTTTTSPACVVGEGEGAETEEACNQMQRRVSCEQETPGCVWKGPTGEETGGKLGLSTLSPGEAETKPGNTTRDGRDRGPGGDTNINTTVNSDSDGNTTVNNKAGASADEGEGEGRAGDGADGGRHRGRGRRLFELADPARYPAAAVLHHRDDFPVDVLPRAAPRPQRGLLRVTTCRNPPPTWLGL